MKRSTDHLKKMKPDPLRSILPSFLLRSLTWSRWDFARLPNYRYRLFVAGNRRLLGSLRSLTVGVVRSAWVAVFLLRLDGVCDFASCLCVLQGSQGQV